MAELDARAARMAAEIRARLCPESGPEVLLQVGHPFPEQAVPMAASVPLGELDGLPDRAHLGTPPKMGLLASAGDGVLALRGHRYLFEGQGMEAVLLPVAAAIAAGVRNVVLVEPCLSLRDDLRTGAWLVATDYVNNLGHSPLATFPGGEACPFLDMTDAFSQELNAELINAVAETCVAPRLGVYQADIGPHYPTPAEAEVARRNGADVLGNAIVPEAVLATSMGCRVAGLLLVVGHAATYRGKRHRHDATLDAAEFCGPPMLQALFAAIRDMRRPAENG